MKIKRFNINESLDPDIKEYVDNFIGCVDNGVPDWVSVVSLQTTLKEYEHAEKSSFAESKNLKKLEKYLSFESEIARLNTQIERLEKNRKKLEIEASSELLYKFQEELLGKDFVSLFKLFIEDDNRDENEDGDDLTYSELHPEIIKKYKDEILLKIKTLKYNL